MRRRPDAPRGAALGLSTADWRRLDLLLLLGQAKSKTELNGAISLLKNDFIQKLIGRD